MTDLIGDLIAYESGDLDNSPLGLPHHGQPAVRPMTAGCGMCRAITRAGHWSSPPDTVEARVVARHLRWHLHRAFRVTT